MDEKQHIQRWRLILGSESQDRFGQMGGEPLSQEQDLMDQALAAIYNRREAGGFGNGSNISSQNFSNFSFGNAGSFRNCINIFGFVHFNFPFMVILSKVS